jgi:hypothetical protein
MSVNLKEFGDILSYQDVNEILKLFASSTAPSAPYEGQVYIDISSSPPKIMRYNGTAWDQVGMTAASILSALLTVDGTGSGLDADKLEGQHGSFYKNADNLESGIIPAARHGWWTDSSGVNTSPRLETGTVTIAAALTQVTFNIAFTNTPRVVVTVDTGNSSSFRLGVIRNVTSTGFRVIIYDSTATAQSGTILYQATGQQ